MIPWNSHDSWKGHINYMIPKLSSPCYVMRTVKFYVSHNTLKIIYYSYSHSIMNYGILFWGPSTESIKIFKLQKRIIRIMMGCKRNQSCRALFVKLGILPLHSQYILSLLMLLFKNKHQFPVNTEIHHHATRQQSNFHQPPVYLTKYQKGICYLGIKVFNKLPPYIKDEFENIRKFKRRLKNFLHEKSFYSLQEYRVIHKSLWNFRTRLHNNQDRHDRKELINR